jgi:hypothetical protein
VRGWGGEEWGGDIREGAGGKAGEMTQTLYARMNKNKNRKKDTWKERTHLFLWMLS